MSGPEFRTLYQVNKPTLVDGQFTPLQCTSHGSVYTGGSSAVAALDIDFVGGQAWVNGVATPITSLISCTRAAPALAYYQTASGLLTPFAANTLRLGNNGLLVEEQRVNLLLQSGTFTALWPLTNITNLTTTTIGPDAGPASAVLLNENTVNGQHYIDQSFAKAASALPYSFSCYAKQGPGRTRVFLQMQDGSNGTRYSFDLAGGQISPSSGYGAGFTSTSASISALSSGWYRCSTTMTSSTATNIDVVIGSDNGSGTSAPSISYAGVVGNGCYISNAQLEQAAFPTSYIPTTTAAVTRNADQIPYISPLSIFTPAAGTFYIWVAAPPQTASPWPWLLGDNGSADAFGMIANAGTSNWCTYDAFQGAVANSSVACTAGAAKIAGTYLSSKAETICVNGGAVASGTATGAPSQYVAFWLGSAGGSSNFLNTYIKRMTFWNVALSNVNIQAITK